MRRVSGLIVSAGLGVAIWTGFGCGVALADSPDSGATGGESATSESTESAAEESTPASPQAEDAPEPDGSEDESEAAEDETEAVEEEPDERPKSKKSRTSVSVPSDTETSSAVIEVPPTEMEPPVTPAEDEPVDETPPEKSVVLAPPPAQREHVSADLPAGTEAVAKVVATAHNPFSAAGDGPEVPVGTPAEWAFLAAARREITPPALEVTTIASVVATDWESPYTGTPSFVHQLVVVGLRVVDLVLKPFGGLLAFTSLEVPLFTDGVPPFFFRHGLNVTRSEFDGMPVWTLQPKSASEKYIVALHGGAYVAEASLFHWWTYTDMARDTGATVVVPLYPLVPDGGTAEVAVPTTADLIEQLIAEHGAGNVSVIGDSAGGGLALAATQEIVRRGSPVPSRMVLFAPWLDVTMSDPLSARLDPGDPLLDVLNLLEAGEDWGGSLGADHWYASPLYGSLEGLPPTAVYSGSLDLLTPDTLRLQQLALENGYDNFTFNLSRGLLHDWVIFGFLPDAHAVRPSVYRDVLA